MLPQAAPHSPPGPGQGHPAMETGKQVVSNCENQAVVAVLTSCSSKEKNLMRLLHCLFFAEATFHFQLTAVYLPGVDNKSRID